MEKLRRISWQAETLRYRLSHLIENCKIELLYRSNKEFSDWKVLEFIFPFLSYRLREKTFELIQQQFGEVKTALDIGAGSDPLKSIILANASKVIAVDPGYSAYEMDSYPRMSGETCCHIFGSRWQKAEMIKRLKLCLKKLEIPKRIEGSNENTIRGIRHGRQKTIKLVPDDASLWINNYYQNYHQPAQLIVVWRVFPPAKTWGDILATLNEGGVLITTGYGEATPGERDFPSIVVGTANTALPRNGNTKAIGLEPLVNPRELFVHSPYCLDDCQNIYFYRKVKPLPPEEIKKALLNNY